MTRTKSKLPRLSLGLLSVEDAAYYLGIGTRTLRRYAAEGDIEHRRVGRLLKFERATLDDFVRPLGGKKSTGRAAR